METAEGRGRGDYGCRSQPTPKRQGPMSEDRRGGIVYSGSSGELVTAEDALGAPCWEPQQQERRWAATATALETLRSSLGNRQPSRIVDLGCGSGELTTRIASLWPAAEIVAAASSGTVSSHA